MDWKISKLTMDYAVARKMLDEALQNEDSDPNRVLDLKKAKDYRATQLADYILYNLQDIRARLRQSHET